MRIFPIRNMIGAALMGVIALGFAMVPASSHDMAEPMVHLDLIDVGVADIVHASVDIGDIAIEHNTVVSMSDSRPPDKPAAPQTTLKTIDMLATGSYGSAHSKPDTRLRC